MQQVTAFNIKINPLTTDEYISLVRSGIKDGHRLIQIGINSASVNLLSKSDQFRKAISKADLVSVDGISVLWALRFLGHRIPERVATPDLADRIISMAETESFSIFLFGADETSLLSCVKNLKSAYPALKIAGYRNGYFKNTEEQQIINSINSSNPDILLIALPSPQKELFYERYGHTMNVKYILGVGGYFDILAGITRRAPLWIQKIGMEWFFRLIQEPGRLWRRYLYGNMRFFWLTLKEKFSDK